MGRSNETWSKREKEKKKQKRKEEKQKRKEARAEANDGPTSFDDMIAYVDANGNITDTPPDPSEKEEIDAEDIIIGIPPKGAYEEEEEVTEGTVTFFDTSKGYGFIKIKGSQESLFTHIKSHIDEISEGNLVTFDRAMGDKGPVAINVKIKR
jgi:cold shock CspA family protein